MGLIIPNERDIQRMLNKYHLNDLSPDALDIAIQIAKTSPGDELDSASAQLTFNTKDRAVVASLTTLIRQNWIIINQLSELTQALGTIGEKIETVRAEEERKTDPKKTEINTEGMTECTIEDAIQYLTANGKTLLESARRRA